MNKLSLQKQKRRDEIIFWLYRCGYIELSNGKIPERLATRSFLSAGQWRILMDIRMKFKKFRSDVLELMRELQGDEILASAFRYDELFEKHFHPGDDGPPCVTLDDAYIYTQQKSLEFAVWAERGGHKISGMDEYEQAYIYKQYLRERSKRQDQRF